MRLADRYRILRRVGEGGGGGVYLVRDRLADDAEMVLKRLHTQAQVGVAQWLVNEFRILAQLDMPSVARVFDFGLAEPDAEDPGGAFFTREFVDGTPLDGALGPPERIPAARLVELFTAAAETLASLHRLGVVHGDLKPANLVVPRQGPGIVLIDFGLAHGALGAAERVRGGTLAFMPPERRDQLLLGESLAPDPRADLYSLSASLLAVLGLEGADAPPPAWFAHRTDLEGLFEIARRGASAEPAARFATADDFLAAITGGAARPTRAPSRVVLRPEGRESELGALLEHVARRLVRREGGGASVLLAGPEGSGRSTLLRELTWRAQLRGVQVLSVQGDSGEGPARALREGARVLSGAESVAEETEALVGAFRRAAEKAPLLLLADDLDRADPGVAALLRSLAYACEPGDTLLIVASGEDESLAARFAPSARVEVGPLDEAAVAALCTQILGPVEPNVAAAVRARTGGLPLAVHEMLVALGGVGGVSAADVERVEVPPRARDLARRRALALPPGVLRAAAAVAALGASSEPELVARVAGEGASADAARAAGLVTLRADGRLALGQPAMREALLDALGVEDRAALLARVAQALEDSGAAPAERAQAWVRAGDGARALAHAEGAVRDLRGVGLPLAAAEFLATLRALAPEAGAASWRLLELELRGEAGDAAGCVRLADGLAAGGEEAVAQRARLLGGKALLKCGEIPRAQEVLRAGLSRAGDGDAAGEFLAEIAAADMRAGQFSECARRCEEGLSRASSRSVRAALLSRRGLALSYLGEQSRAAEMLEQALSLYAEEKSSRDEARVLAYLAIVRDRQGDLPGARGLLERTLERARSAGDVLAMASARLHLGALLDRLGDLGGALDHYAASAKLALRGGDAVGALAARLNTAGDLMRLGSYERARVEIDAVLAQARAGGLREFVAQATALWGVVRARTGDADAGLGLLAEACERFAAMGQADGAAEAYFDAAEILLDRGLAGDVPRAFERLERAREALGALDALPPRARMLDARIMLGRGDARGALISLAEAVSGAEASGEWEVLALSLGARAECHRAMGAEIHARRDRERALEVLEATASMLPPDLRSAFWAVPSRVALRSTNERSWSEPSVPLGGPSPASPAVAPGALSFSSNAPTAIAHDQRLVLLLELSRRVGEEKTLERVLDQAVRSAVELTNAERGAVILVGPDGSLSVRARSGASRDDGPDESFSRSIAESALIDGEVVTTHNARGDNRFADFRSVHELAIGAVVAVPIRARGRALGVLYVENRLRRSSWSGSDVALLKAFAEQAGVAVDHARLVEELETRSRELEAAKREIEELLAVRTQELETTRHSLARAEEALKTRFAPQGMVAQTEAMRKVFAVIERVRDADIPVVIEGESGTGKELVARAIHFSGARAKGPFVVVHCGAIPETLLESELFGHVKGAFTGADRDRKGLLASAHGGTLMLDEVSEMPLRMQVELLRVLQDRRVRPVGGDRDELVDLRVIAATHRALKDLVADGRFREDLYYRLSVVTVRLPPLRARLDDIPALASHFLARIAEEHGMPRKRLSRDALSRLLRAAWPGNVRQLRHVLESAAVLAEGDVIEADQLGVDEPGSASIPPPAPSANPSIPPPAASPLAVRKAAERQRILDALEQVNWNKVRAATVLGMPRRTLYRRLREYGLLEE